MPASQKGVLVLAMVTLMAMQGCLSAIVSDTASQTTEEMDAIEQLDPDVYTCFHAQRMGTVLHHLHSRKCEDSSSNAPLIVELHGWAAFQPLRHGTSRASPMLADEVGAIVVHAEGIIVENSTVDMGGNEESWNAGYCCGDAVAFEIDDVDYLRKVIAKTVEAYPVDENRIYLTGWSNGCMMAQRMALQASDLVAAMACTSGYLSIHDSEGYMPVPVMEIHGFIDENQQYTNTVNWGIVDENRRNLESMQTGAIENMYDWAEYNELRRCRTRPK